MNIENNIIIMFSRSHSPACQNMDYYILTPRAGTAELGHTEGCFLLKLALFMLKFREAPPLTSPEFSIKAAQAETFKIIS